MEKRSRSRQTTTAEPRTTRASSRSPSRRSNREKSPVQKSPARTRSPARAPSRAKANAIAAATTATTQRRSGRNRLLDNDTASETDDSKSEKMTRVSVRVSPLKVERDGTVRTPTKALRSKTSNVSSEGDDEVASLTARFVSDRLRRRVGDDPTPSDLSTRRSFSRSVSRGVAQEDSWDDASDWEDDTKRIRRSRSKAMEPAPDTAAEFGGSIGAFALTLLVPLVCVAAQYVCSRPECNVNSVRWEKLKLLNTYFTTDAAIIFLSFHWIVSLVSLLPYTGVRRNRPNATHKNYLFNGFFTAAVTAAGLLIAEFCYQQQIFALIYKNYQQLIVLNFISALLISIWCFIRSRYVPSNTWNPLGSSGRLVSDFFMGRETEPEWFGVFHIKLIHRRMALISILIINIVFLVRNVKYVAPAFTPAASADHPAIAFLLNLHYDKVAAVVSAIWILYVLDQLVHEHHLISSMELGHDGVGAQQLLYYASFPVLVNLWAKYANQHKIADVPCAVLAGVAIVAIAGIALKRRANYIKYTFRAYPDQKGYETIPSLSVDRTFVLQSVWRRVRHPNITGELVLVLAFLPLLYFRFAWPPLAATVLLAASLIHRARRLDNFCKQNNGQFVYYADEVHYSLIPRVY